MMYLEDILFSLYEIKEYAEILNKNTKDEEVQNFTSRIAEHAKTAIYNITTEMTVERFRLNNAFKEVERRENTGEEEEET